MELLSCRIELLWYVLLAMLIHRSFSLSRFHYKLPVLLRISLKMADIIESVRSFSLRDLAVRTGYFDCCDLPLEVSVDWGYEKTRTNKWGRK